MMSDEIIDVVDENDKVIGKEWKSICHKKGLIHRTSTIFVLNSKNELLLQKRIPTKELYPNKWCSSCAGHLLSGDTYEEGAKRELMEELGIDVPIKKIGFFRYSTIYGLLNDKEFYTMYVAHHDEPFNFQKEEMTEVRFFSFKELMSLMKKHPEQFTPALFEELDHFQEYISNHKMIKDDR